MKKQAVASHKFYALRSLDFTQTLLFVQTTQVGIGLFNLPRVVSEKAGHSGWISIIIAGLIMQVSVWIIIKLLKRFKDLDIYGILNTVFGKWIGNACGALFALYCVFVSAIVTRSYIEVVQQWLFPTTSTMMFYILLILPTVYCALGGARVLGQFAVVTFFSTIWMMLLLIVPAEMIQTDYYRPLMDFKVMELISATYQVSASAVGFEVLLTIYPFVQNKKKALLASSIGIWVTTIIYLIVVVISIGFYSQDQIKNLISPTLHLFKIVTLPIIERIEHIGIVTWSFLVVGTSAAYLWSAARYLTQFNKWKPNICLLVLMPIMYAIGSYPNDIILLTSLQEILGIVGGVISIVVPPLLLIAALLLRKKAEQPKPEDANQDEEVQVS